MVRESLIYEEGKTQKSASRGNFIRKNCLTIHTKNLTITRNGKDPIEKNTQSIENHISKKIKSTQKGQKEEEKFLKKKKKKKWNERNPDEKNRDLSTMTE